MAIKESSPQGVGPGGFPAAYAEAQINYFKNEKGTETEKLVAGSPEYAFNEYLRMFSSKAFWGILFLVLTILIIQNGIRNKQTGAAGSFLALSVFAFASYPFYLWEFLVVWVVLGSVCVSAAKDCRQSSITKRCVYLSILFLTILFAGMMLCLRELHPYLQAEKEWGKVRPRYSVQFYSTALDSYAELYPMLNHNQRFVFEYAVMLNAAKQQEKADSVLSADFN